MAHYKNDKPIIKIFVTLEGKLEGTQCNDDMRKLETNERFQNLI